ncbi:hypothetical protein AB1N83_011384 [Pleurotus pulmonarius]
MPAFLLGIGGPNITVSGAIYVEGVITERLTDIISLVPVLSSQEPLGHPSARDQLAYRIAHLLICLRECLDQLADEYASMSSLRATDDFALVPSPHFSSFRAETVGKFCVVTEFVEEKESAQLTTEGVKTLRDAVKALHEHALVFGDLRDANVLVDTRGNPYLIDFDWSGAEGTVRYPLDLNTAGIDWAEGVRPGAKIRREHDVDMLEKLLKVIS